MNCTIHHNHKLVPLFGDTLDCEQCFIDYYQAEINESEVSEEEKYRWETSWELNRE